MKKLIILLFLLPTILFANLKENYQYEEAIKLSTNNQEIGSLYYYLNKPKLAKEYLEKADDNFLRNFYLARVLIDLKEYEPAILLLDKCAKTDPAFAATYFYLGKIFEELGEIDEAIKNYSEALKKDAYFVEVKIPLNRIDKSKDNKKQPTRIRNIAPKIKEAKETHQKFLTLEQTQKLIKLTHFIKFSLPKNRDKIPLIRVGISGGKTFKSVTIRMKSGKKKTIMPAQVKKRIKFDAVILEGIETAADTRKNNFEHQYRGKIELLNVNGELRIINIVSLEEYLYSVLPSEIMVNWPDEAIKAQAVLARNHIVYKLKGARGHQKDGYDVCDSQHCQVYGGVNAEYQRMNNFVDETRGEVLEFDGKVVLGLFHSNSGGYTQDSGEVKYWSPSSYLKGVLESTTTAKIDNIEEWIKTKSAVFSNVPRLKYPVSFRWIRIVDPKFVADNVPEVGKIKNIYILKRSKSGHVNGIKIVGENGEKIVEKEDQIRKVLGLGSLRSTLFWLETKMNEGFATEFTFFGGGWGHGIGMSQTGAAGMADEGYSYKDILMFYYTGTKLERLDY